ncbi:MAG: ABC transporter permease subunit [Acholeplasmatales bacterium]|jgi:putative aldouronate transport system permease protein|nr:ABC transporter permease subunit [Acholeplasmatales bacterium]
MIDSELIFKSIQVKQEGQKRTKLQNVLDQLKKDWMIYAMIIPVIVFFYLFRYRPIGSILVAFKRTEDPGMAIESRYFLGLFNFKAIMFGDFANRFWRAFRNTFTISGYGLFFGFPIPIVIALMFSEIKSSGFRAVTQIISYLPKFISTVVITLILSMMLLSPTPGLAQGFLNKFLVSINVIKPNVNVLFDTSKYFRSIYILSGMWEGSGYGSIVYFAAIMAINPTNYEAAKIDGANKLDQIRHVTFPGMAPTLTIMLILRIGEILTVGYEKILLLTNFQVGPVQETAEVISTFVINLSGMAGVAGGGGAGSFGIGYAAAADLFNSVIAMLLVLGANYVSKKVSSTSLF